MQGIRFSAGNEEGNCSVGCGIGDEFLGVDNGSRVNDSGLDV